MIESGMLRFRKPRSAWSEYFFHCLVLKLQNSQKIKPLQILSFFLQYIAYDKVETASFVFRKMRFILLGVP